MKILKNTFYFFVSATIISAANCNKPPYKMDEIGGIVIAKEKCHTDTTKDYWLMDFTLFSDSPPLGDTLTINGVFYTNVLKVKGLESRFQKIGSKVSIDYRKVSDKTVISTDCEVATPQVYSLKEICIINQFAIP